VGSRQRFCSARREGPPWGGNQAALVSKSAAAEAARRRLVNLCVAIVASTFGCPRYPHVRFCNRPFEVKRFQAIHHGGVDVARGLVLLSGIGTMALPSWDSRTRRNNLLIGRAVEERRVQADMRTHLIHRPARDILPLLGGT